MKKLTVKKLRLLRNIIILAGIIGTFILWLYAPSVIENNTLVHVGNEKYGSKLGSLLILILPLLGLIPHKPGEEIHTENIIEKAALEDEQRKKSTALQLVFAVFGTLTAYFLMLLLILFG